MRRLVSLCLMALMGVLLVVSKEALAFLPNFEVVSLFIVLFTQSFGILALGAVAVFLALEGLLYGFGIWWVMYLYVWPLLFLLAWLFRWMRHAWQWAVLSGLFGLSFGALCSLVYLPAGGVPMVLGWIASGFPFDISHCIGNFLLMIVLYWPLWKALERCVAMAGRWH